LTGADASEGVLCCLDLRSGALLWRERLSLRGPSVTTQADPATGFAAPTPATDGRRVYALFGTGDLAAWTLDGKLVWSKNLGPVNNPYGHSSSLVTWNDRLLVQLDQGEPEAGQSSVAALNGLTGEVIWRHTRRVGSSWASPIVIVAAGKPQLIALAVPAVTSYAPADGTELWRVECLSGEVTPSPAFAAGLVLVASPSEKLLAIRADGTGDVTKTHVAWSNEENVPDVTSPVSNGEFVFTLTSSGTLTCLAAKDGRKCWQHEFELEFHSSPIIAGDQLYLFSLKGDAIVVQVGQDFKELFRTSMTDAFHATPAVALNRVVIRGETNVWCLGGDLTMTKQ
jgi:outer membrane protein assembly factor BamB